jgi:hypothetical protein
MSQTLLFLLLLHEVLRGELDNLNLKGLVVIRVIAKGTRNGRWLLATTTIRVVGIDNFLGPDLKITFGTNVSMTTRGSVHVSIVQETNRTFMYRIIVTPISPLGNGCHLTTGN